MSPAKAPRLLGDMQVLDVVANQEYPQEFQPEPWALRRTKILLYRDAQVPCAECGRPGYGHWTMTCCFRCAARRSGPVSGSLHPPLTPVCQEHYLVPEWEPEDEPEQGETP